MLFNLKPSNPQENQTTNMYKKELDKIVVAPFNTNKWSLQSGNKAIQQSSNTNNPPASTASSNQPEPFMG